jgi:hypothetical protein
MVRLFALKLRAECSLTIRLFAHAPASTTARPLSVRSREEAGKQRTTFAI